MIGSLYMNSTDGEKEFLHHHPVDAIQIAWNKEKAFDETVRRFGHNGHNDASDAFRHCFWSALLMRDIGEADAREFTTLHESSPLNPPNEKAMDLHNNSVGIELGKSGGSDTVLSDKSFAALQAGRLMVIQ